MYGLGGTSGTLLVFSCPFLFPPWLVGDEPGEHALDAEGDAGEGDLDLGLWPARRRRGLFLSRPSTILAYRYI